jgi:pyridoxal phosphate enzyme (YggS family)
VPNPEHPYYQLQSECKRHHATLVVVSKTRPEKDVLTIYEMGQRIFGENRAKELIEKANLLPADIEWHLIGHLQSNKIKSILPIVSCIQSLDSLKLWEKLEEGAKAAGKNINCLLQIKIAKEVTKYGWSFEELDRRLKSGIHNRYSHVTITGVMGMASLTDDEVQVRKEMKQLKHYFDVLKQNHFADDPQFKVVSMGMSGDYKIALEEGSTMVRIGSLLLSS